jgi:hypothetical protein
MRARVLFTNGTKTIDLFWLSHDGSDVYCGQPGVDGKRSYHASGKIHSTTKTERTDGCWHTPLQDLKGQFHLTTLALTNSAEWFDVVAPKFEYSGKKSDAVLIVDSRSIPEDITFNVLVGLLEPGNTNVLCSMITAFDEVLGGSTKQVLLSTSVKPWVYAILRSLG